MTDGQMDGRTDNWTDIQMYGISTVSYTICHLDFKQSLYWNDMRYYLGSKVVKAPDSSVSYTASLPLLHVGQGRKKTFMILLGFGLSTSFLPNIPLNRFTSTS